MDIGVERRHDVQRLDHVGAILAGQREECFEVIFAVEFGDLCEQVGVFFWCVTSDVEQG